MNSLFTLSCYGSSVFFVHRINEYQNGVHVSMITLYFGYSTKLFCSFYYLYQSSYYFTLLVFSQLLFLLSIARLFIFLLPSITLQCRLNCVYDNIRTIVHLHLIVLSLFVAKWLDYCSLLCRTALRIAIVRRTVCVVQFNVWCFSKNVMTFPTFVVDKYYYL